MIRVRTYWNLHKRCFSVQSRETRRVIAHLPSLFLTDVKFIVYEHARQRVLREKKKNVHAFVEGNTQERWINLQGFNIQPVFYNPYKMDSFQTAEGVAVKAADLVYLSERRVYILTVA